MSRGLGGTVLAALVALAAPGVARAEDTTPPVPDLVGHPIQGTRVSDTTASFEVTTNEGTVTCTLDGAAWPCAADSTVTLSRLPDGDHTFAVIATDAAGNQGTESRSWTVDTVAPVPVGILGAAFTAGPYARFPFGMAFGPDAGLDGPYAYRCWLDGTEVPHCLPGTDYRVRLADGTHTTTQTVTDRAGNVSIPKTYTWTIDTVAPDTTLSAHTPAHETNASFAFASSEPQTTFECRLDAAKFAPCASPLRLRGLAAGRHTLRVRAVDRARNRDATPAVSNWVVVPPVPAKLDARFGVHGAVTTARRLRVTTVPGARVVAACGGHGCPIGRRHAVAPSSGVVDIAAVLRHRSLPAGAHLRIVVSARGYVTRTATFVIREGRPLRGGSLR